MGQFFGNNSSNDGTILHYDSGDKVNSYAGQPINNYWHNGSGVQSLRAHTLHYWDGKNWSEESPYQGDPGAPGPEGEHIGIVYKHVSGALNSTWSNTSYGYMLKDLSTPTGTMTAMHSWIYASEDCNLDAIPAVIEGESGGEATIANYVASYDLNNKSTWQIVGKKAISDGNTRYIPLYPRKSGVTDGSFTGFFLWGGAVVTVGDTVVRYPQSYTSNDDNTELKSIHKNPVSDYTGIDLEAHNISFDENSNIYFDGSDDYIDLGRELGNLVGAEATVETVFKSMRTDDTVAFILGWGVGNSFYSSVGIGNWFGAQPDESVHIGINPGGSGTNQPNVLPYARGGHTKYNDQQYHHLVAKLGSYNWEIWVDGEKLDLEFNSGSQSTYADSLFNYGRTDVDLFIGARPYGGTTNYFKGYIPILKIYNRAISSEEILRNFNSVKKRFDI